MQRSIPAVSLGQSTSSSPFNPPVMIRPLAIDLNRYSVFNDLSVSPTISEPEGEFLKPCFSIEGEQQTDNLDLDINEISFQLLDEIDPSFWSLKNYMVAVRTFSGPYYQDLSFNQLIKSYTASLCLHKLKKDNHYYEKSAFFEPSNNKLLKNLITCHLQHKSVDEDRQSGEKKLLNISLQKLGDILFQIETSSENFANASLQQSRIWPNESSVSNIVKYYPIFDQLLPLKRVAEKAELCLENLKSELRENSSLDISEDKIDQFIETIANEVHQWSFGQREIPNTPRKRSFDLVDADADDRPPMADQDRQNSFESSPFLRVKSQIRKRRRYSVA